MKKGGIIFTKEQLRKLPLYEQNKEVIEADTPPQQKRLPKPKDKTKQWIRNVVKAFAEANNLLYLEEYQFDAERKWRFDYALMGNGAVVCAIEYEGLLSKKSRHTTISGYTGDTDKYRAAALQGITVLRYTALNYQTISSDLSSLKL